MFITSLSSTIIISCCYVLMVLCFQSSSAYVLDSNEWPYNLLEQDSESNSPSFSNRYIRTTKFPRIGRSIFDQDYFDVNTSTNSEEDSLENEAIEERSVLFPRIGKRAFHNLLWASSLSNPHRMLDAQGRHYLKGYEYDIHPVHPQALPRYRGKRSVSM